MKPCVLDRFKKSRNGGRDYAALNYVFERKGKVVTLFRFALPCEGAANKRPSRAP